MTYLYPRKIYAVSVIIPMYNAEKYIGEFVTYEKISARAQFRLHSTYVGRLDDTGKENAVTKHKFLAQSRLARLEISR